MLILCAVLIFLVALLWFNQIRNESRLNAVLSDSQASLSKPLYRCVKIETGEHVCHAALEYENKSILMNDAPILPLKSCDASQCDCRFLRFDDRRMGKDRRNQQSAAISKAYADKRFIRDRRRASIKQWLLPQNIRYQHKQIH
jgi:hypothetical protein